MPIVTISVLIRITVSENHIPNTGDRTHMYVVCWYAQLHEVISTTIYAQIPETASAYKQAFLNLLKSP